MDHFKISGKAVRKNTRDTTKYQQSLIVFQFPVIIVIDILLDGWLKLYVRTTEVQYLHVWNFLRF